MGALPAPLWSADGHYRRIPLCRLGFQRRQVAAPSRAPPADQRGYTHELQATTGRRSHAMRPGERTQTPPAGSGTPGRPVRPRGRPCGTGPLWAWPRSRRRPWAARHPVCRARSDERTARRLARGPEAAGTALAAPRASARSPADSSERGAQRPLLATCSMPPGSRRRADAWRVRAAGTPPRHPPVSGAPRRLPAGPPGREFVSRQADVPLPVPSRRDHPPADYAHISATCPRRRRRIRRYAVEGRPSPPGASARWRRSRRPCAGLAASRWNTAGDVLLAAVADALGAVAQDAGVGRTPGRARIGGRGSCPGVAGGTLVGGDAMAARRRGRGAVRGAPAAGRRRPVAPCPGGP